MLQHQLQPVQSIFDLDAHRAYLQIHFLCYFFSRFSGIEIGFKYTPAFRRKRRNRLFYLGLRFFEFHILQRDESRDNAIFLKSPYLLFMLIKHGLQIPLGTDVIQATVLYGTDQVRMDRKGQRPPLVPDIQKNIVHNLRANILIEQIINRNRIQIDIIRLVQFRKSQLRTVVDLCY